MRKNKKAAIRPCLSPLLFSVLDAFGQEVTSGKSLDNAAKKAKLLQIGFNIGKDRYMNWL